MPSLADMERVLENLDRRLRGVEQFLPTLATKADLDRYPTKADLDRYATKSDLERFATKADLERFATKADLERFATKTDLERFAAKADLERFATKADLESGLAQVRAFTEQVRDEVRSLAEGYELLSGRVDSLSTDVRGVLYTLDTLVTRLEAKNVI